MVTATMLPTPESEIGSSLTVITSQDIAQKQERTLPEVLNDVPGLNVVQTGSPGGTTSVFIRGANANHTKVLVDGIDVSDPSSPDNSFDFSQILASDIARVEVLRGPASGLYGSDAIGGVINIITKAGSGPPHVYGTLEGGSFDTFNQTTGLSGSVGRFSYNFDFAHYHSGATDVTPTGFVPPGVPLNPDYYDNRTVSTKLGAQLTDNFDVGAVLRYVDTDLNTTSDDFSVFPPAPEAAQSYNRNHELFTRGFAHLVLFDGQFEQTVGFGYTGYWRNFLDPNTDALALSSDPSDYHGVREKIDWQGTVKLVPGETLVLGAEHQIERLNNTNPASAHVTNDAGYIELQSNVTDRIFNAASFRYDDNGSFGGHPTFREAPAYLIPETGTKIKGSVGTGFKAPTLDELYDNYPSFGFFANPNLRPETSLGYDMGFEETLWDKQVGFGSTYFHNDIDNLIQVNSTGTTYENIGQATTYGAENYVAYKPWEPLTLRVDYTYTMANDDITHTELLRRPKHKASLNAKWQATEALSFTATAVYTGKWADINRDGTASGLFATPYTLINLAGNYDIGNGLSFFARINNLLDRHYQDPIGFQHQGFGVFAGVKVAFDVPTTLPGIMPGATP
ncbi:MAG TPA: TonB-dependent receptor [Stellaceae bacterium]|nr:TonB-dependent receptor [Stellaceae bacterium]